MAFMASRASDRPALNMLSFQRLPAEFFVYREKGVVSTSVLVRQRTLLTFMIFWTDLICAPICVAGGAAYLQMSLRAPL